MQHTTDHTINLPAEHLISLGEELSRLAQALSKIGQKLQKVSAIPEVKITSKTDPEMFTAEFLKIIRKSRQEFEKGGFTDYLTFRKTLNFR